MMNRSAVCTWAHVRGEERFARAGKVHADICIKGHVLDEMGRLGSPLANYGEFFTSYDPDRCLTNHTAPIASCIFSALSLASV